VLRSAVLLAAAVLALPVAAAAGQEPVPPGLSREQPISVAGDTIALSEIRHWARIGAVGGRPGRPELTQAAMLLISIRWIHGEARALGVRVTGGRVGRALRAQLRANFGSWRAFHAYLHENGQTLADVRLRVRSDLESTRLRKLAIGDATDPEEQQARLLAYVEEFDARWRAQTVCTPRFAVLASVCGNVPVE
jgi:hypothetical protein